MDTVRDKKDDELPTGPIELPPDPPPPNGPVESAETQTREIGAADDEVVPAAPPVVMAQATDSQIDVLRHKLEMLRENGTAWVKTHKFLAVVIILLVLGFLLYFWPIITSMLIAQHMMKNTKGTQNKTQMYKIVAIILVISLSIQALWIVQLAQATSFAP